MTALPAIAQFNGVPPSVTSIRPNGQLSGAPPASVTSIGPLGFTPVPFNFGVPVRHHHGIGINGAIVGGSGGRRHSRIGPVVPVPFYTPYPAYPLVYPMYGAPGMAYGAVDDSGAYDDDETADAPAPTIFEHRSIQARPYETQPRVLEPAPAPVQTAADALPPAPQQEAAEQDPTVLVFRDGHRLEVRNYAIVGRQLFNFSDAGPRKIALADLDVEATVRANDDRGVEFRLPPNHAE